ncbi:RimK family protein [bacterium]|nr:RimK family protein [bacterium]
MSNLIVVNDPKDWPIDTPGVQVVAARAYLTDPAFAQLRQAKVFNLCRSYRYQALGYYVSLLAAARGHKTLPAVNTIQDLKSMTLIRFVSEDLEREINRSLAPIQSSKFTLSIYFGKNVAKRYDRLSSQLFRYFPAPLMQAHFVNGKDGWVMQNIGPIGASEIPAGHHEVVLEFAREYFEKRPLPSGVDVPSGRYSMAILFSGEEEMSPSDTKAIARFQRAFEKLDFDVEIITRDDYGRLAEFDALFIRDLTGVNHHSYRFARRAKAEGLVVIDDPDSILRCTNKVFLAELLTRAKIPTPKTVILHRDNINEMADTIGLPCILKQPDSSFSQGVVKVDTEEELQAEAKRFLERSELVIAQEFLPTAFDWRIGILDRQPLYVCRYHMARSHWQIVKRDAGGKERWGKSETIPLWQAPPNVVQTAVRAANLIGDGLYGVDLKESNGNCYIIEINDNPDIVAGYEDADSKDQLYQRFAEVFLNRIERKKERRAHR